MVVVGRVDETGHPRTAFHTATAVTRHFAVLVDPEAGARRNMSALRRA